jgi:carboxyl-terminal processing protease
MEDQLPEVARQEARKNKELDFTARFRNVKQLLVNSGRSEGSWVSGALNAWIANLDLHARLLPAREKMESIADDRIQVQGAGAKLRFLEGKVLVGYVVEGSGAEAAGLLTGDEIIGVNERDLQGMTTTQKRVLFRNVKAPYRVKLRRGLQTISALVGERRYVLANVETHLGAAGIGVIRVRTFDKERTCSDLKEALLAMEARGAKSLELDLRNNPGGLVREAQCAAGLLLGRGHLFARLKKFDNPELQGLLPSTLSGSSVGSNDEVSLITDEATVTSLPLQVRINQNTASAAEMVAAALQDNKRALVLGSRSFGKGSMQSTFHPWNDRDLFLLRTTHLIIRPSGKKIQYAGVSPDLVLEKSEGKNFPREQNLTPDAMN